MGSYQAPRPLGREESRGGGHTVPRGAAGKGRGAAKLDARSSRRSAVAAEMLPAPPPLPPPRQPPRGKLTRAVGSEESEAVPGTPGGTRRGRNSEGGGRADRQTDSEGARAGANGALRGALPPPAHRGAGCCSGVAHGEPWAQLPGPTGMGRGGEGASLRPATPSCELGSKSQPAPGGAVLGRTFRLAAGVCTWRSQPGPALWAPALWELTLRPWAASGATAPPAGHAPGRSGPRQSSASSPGCFSACLQLPDNFFCLMER